MAWESAGSGGGGLPTKLCKKRTVEGDEVTKGLCVLLEKSQVSKNTEEIIGIHPTLRAGDRQ